MRKREPHLSQGVYRKNESHDLMTHDAVSKLQLHSERAKERADL